MRDLRDRARLSELLLGRNHGVDAVAELVPIAAEAWDDASLRHLRARAFEAAGNTAVVEASLGEPKDVTSSYGPWWATRGRFARARGDGATADGFFQEAVAADPLDVECACESLDSASSTASAGAPGVTTLAAPYASPAPGALCDAARKRGEPSLGGD
jgi:hypothetical protein